MRARRPLLVAALALVPVAVACRRSVDLGGSASACTPCVSDADCPGAVCAQFAGDTYCAPACPSGSECGADMACTALSTAAGEPIEACVPRGDACGPGGGGGTDAGGGGTCGALDGPAIASSCASCSATSRSCQPNGCYNGWYCNTQTRRCQPPPSSCAVPDGGVFDGGPPVTGTVGPNGGTLSRLYFGVLGDTRPATLDDTAGYPSTVLGTIFSGLSAVAPSPPFVLSTGDYVYASTRGGEAAKQLDAYLAARGAYAGVLFPALGNQECAGYTDSNCGAGARDGLTANYQSYLSKMLAPIGQTSPYYAVDVDATDGSWTAKFVVIAANAWSDAQGDWLESTLSRATTYTFVVRHEPSYATSAPGVPPSEAILARHPYTLLFVGHAHTYERSGARQLTIGNGGAPLTGDADYGFAIAQQRADGAIQVDMLDYATRQPDPSFRLAVHPDGTPAP